MTTSRLLLLLLAVGSSLFYPIGGLYICFGEAILLLSMILFPNSLLYSIGKVPLYCAIIILFIAFLASEIGNGSSPQLGIVYFFRFVIFVTTYYVTSYMLRCVPFSKLRHTLILVLFLMAFSSLLSISMFSDGYREVLISTGKIFDFNSQWKFSYSIPFFYLTLAFLILLSNKAWFAIFLSGGFGLLNLYFDNRFVGILFFVYALYLLGLLFLPKKPLYFILWVLASLMISFALYSFLTSNSLLSIEAIARKQVLEDQISSSSNIALSSLNRGTIETTISAALESPLLGSGAYLHRKYLYSIHSIFFFYWALWGLTFPVLLIKVMIIPSIGILPLSGAEGFGRVFQPFTLLICCFIAWHLLFSPLASQRVSWGMLAGIIPSIPLAYSLPRRATVIKVPAL